MDKGKQLCFSGETIYVGVDVHKRNWKINGRMNNMEAARFSQDPDAEKLSEYFKRHYPQAKIQVVYEAGFCGFGIQRSLSKLGIECIVVNASDVPASDKERKRKDDKRDACKLSRQLSEGNLKGIYVPDQGMEQGRCLVRQRHRLVQDQTRCKNRIKQLLLFSGLKVLGIQERWNQKYIKQLQQLDCSAVLKSTLALSIEEYLELCLLVKKATEQIRDLSQQPPFLDVQKLLQSIDGIGLINGMVVQTEIQDIDRFKTLDKLCDYAGLVPDISSSDTRLNIKGVTKRRNEFLREAIIESSWMLIRKDPAMRMKYNQYVKRMNENKAIIRIGKHLLSRIRYVWINKMKYERGIVA